MRTPPSTSKYLDRPNDDLHRRASYDVNTRSSFLTAKQLKLNSHTTSISLISLNGHQLIDRFSSLSSSYAQFLKQRDADKMKRIVSIEQYLSFIYSLSFVDC
jgi:hypothetical protein